MHCMCYVLNRLIRVLQCTLPLHVFHCTVFIINHNLVHLAILRANSWAEEYIGHTNVNRPSKINAYKHHTESNAYFLHLSYMYTPKTCAFCFWLCTHESFYQHNIMVTGQSSPLKHCPSFDLKILLNFRFGKKLLTKNYQKFLQYQYCDNCDNQSWGFNILLIVWTGLH